MVNMAEDEVIGVFIGLESSSYEYIANIVAPYKANFSIEVGSFLIIQDHPTKIIARVIDFVPQGELTSFMGMKWLSDVAFESEAIGSDIKTRKISYSVKIKILGSINEKNVFTPGVQKIPHITSRVIKAKAETIKNVLKQVLNEQEGGNQIGTFFLDSSIKIDFKLTELLGKRTFIFARAGYGKSNLMKILACQWKPEYGSLVIFDPEGEYALTNEGGIPGIMDSQEAIFITNRVGIPDKLNNVYHTLKLNLREIDPQLVIPLIVPAEKHENIFFQKLMGVDRLEWANLVDLIYSQGWRASLTDICTAMGLNPEDASDMKPIKNNLVAPIKNLHNPESHLMPILERAMRQGNIIIFDISMLDSRTALMLSSLIVRRVFHENQKNYISVGGTSLIKATFVMEEAQSVLSGDADVAAFVELAKEGRKYGLGGIFVTQQPASIPFEILSQADNFFVFHLLSKGDLNTLQKANAHYSDDVLTQLLNEPVKGKLYMWTSSQPFVIPIKVDKFEDKYEPNTSYDIQKAHPILNNLLLEIDTELKDPAFQSIIGKYREVEQEGHDELGKKTVALFKKLTSAEKEHLRKKSAIQVGRDNSEFAVKTIYYQQLAVIASTLNVSENN